MKTLITWLRDSIQTVYHSGGPQGPVRSTPAEKALAEQLRTSMLELARTRGGEAAARLSVRIQCAATLQSLWFLRSELMALLSPACGEEEALRRVESISESVRGGLPSSLRGRPSPLARSAGLHAHDPARLH